MLDFFAEIHSLNIYINILIAWKYFIVTAKVAHKIIYMGDLDWLGISRPKQAKILLTFHHIVIDPIVSRKHLTLNYVPHTTFTNSQCNYPIIIMRVIINK